MQFHHQLNEHNPPESFGDCLRTCIACLIDREPASVPNFFDPNEVPKGNELAAMEEFLSDAGFAVLFIDVAGEISALRTYMQTTNPDVLYVLFGDAHAVVCRGGETLHDPSWTELGVRHPTKMLFLLPLSMRYVGE